MPMIISILLCFRLQVRLWRVGGTELSFISLLTHSVLCTASLAVVVMQALRYHLLQDEGIPLGLLGAGLSFNQVSYLWSPEFCLSVKSCLFNKRRWSLYILLLTTGVVAATIGPSIAVLMLPRVQDIPAGGTSYYLNATADQLWPSNITSMLEYSGSSLPNATQYAVCPCGGYESILNTFGGFSYGGFLSGTSAVQPKFQAIGSAQVLNTSTFSFAVQSGSGLLPVMMSSGQLRNGYMGLGTLALQPPAVISVQQQSLLIDWFNSINQIPPQSLNSLAEYHYGGLLTSRYAFEPDLDVILTTSSVSTTFPSVRARCSSTGQNLTEDATTASFPTLAYNSSLSDHTHFRWSPVMANVSIDGLDRNFTTNVRTQWVVLPRQTFGPVSAGLLFEMPWLSGSNFSSVSSRIVVGCTLQASWLSGTTTTTSETSYFAWYIEDWGGVSPSDNDRILNLDSSWLKLLTPIVSDAISYSDYGPLNTLEAIINSTGLSKFYADRLRDGTPDIISSNGSCIPNPRQSQDMTEFENWSLECNPAKVHLLENILATYVADGLSRFNSILTFQPGTSIDRWNLIRPAMSDNYWYNLPRGIDAFNMPDEPSSVLELRTDFTLNGYAYYASGVTDFLAQAVVGLYVLIAATHLIWVTIITRVSSGSWDTVTELIALCQNSPPSKTLRGTSAGIGRLSTYKKFVRLRAINHKDDPSDARVALLFDEDTQQELPIDDVEDDINQHLDDDSDDQKSVKLSAMEQPANQSTTHYDIANRVSQQRVAEELRLTAAGRSKSPASRIQTWPLLKGGRDTKNESLVSLGGDSSDAFSRISSRVVSSRVQIGKKYN